MIFTGRPTLHGAGGEPCRKSPAMLSIPDMALLGVLALLVFGEERLPGIMRQAGRVMREVQNASQGFIQEMERAADVRDIAKRPPAAPPEAPYPDAGPPVEHGSNGEARDGG